MKKHVLIVAIIVGAAAVFGTVQVAVRAGAPEKPQPLLAHDVYFSLNDNSEGAKKEIVAACKEYLSGHPGTVFFAAGVLAEDLNRPVNDRDFDVAAHIIFKDKAAHDAYQKAERHVEFAKQYDKRWKKVRVFDSYVEQ